MLPYPFLCGICLEITGNPDCLRFAIKDERNGLWWSGDDWTPCRDQALGFDNFVAARDEAWRLRSDYVLAWFNDFYGKGAN